MKSRLAAERRPQGMGLAATFPARREGAARIRSCGFSWKKLFFVACTPTLVNSSAMLGLISFATSKSALLAATSPFISLATPRPYSAAGEFGVELERLVVIDQRLIGLAELEIGHAAMIERGGVVRLEAERGVAILERRLQLADDGARAATLVQRLGVVRLQLDRLVVVLDRLVVVTRAVEHVGAVVIGDRRRGAALDGLVDLLDDAVVVALVLIDAGAVVRRDRVVGRDS